MKDFNKLTNPIINSNLMTLINTKIRIKIKSNKNNNNNKL